jgi:hypothetical protein
MKNALPLSATTLAVMALATTGMSLPLLPERAAASPKIAQAQNISRNISQNIPQNAPQSIPGRDTSPAPANPGARPLPRLVDLAVRRDAARRSNRALEELRITRHASEIWPNSCLGLPAAEEACAQGRVSGWRVTVTASPANSTSETAQTWIYRTNVSGRTLRLESQSGVDVGSATNEPRDRSFIGNVSTSTAPLPEEQQSPSARLIPLGGQVRIALINRTNATLTYQVIGDTTLRTLSGQSTVTLQFLDVPTTLTFRRDDGGLLTVMTQLQADPYALDVVLDTAVDLGRDRTTLTIEQTGEVFLN